MDTHYDRGVPLGPDGQVCIEMVSGDLTLGKNYQRTEPRTDKSRDDSDAPIQVNYPTGSGHRGALRAATALTALPAEFDGRDMFLGFLGGIRGSGEDALRGRPSAKLEVLKRLPLLAIFGAGGPAFIAGGLKVGDMMLAEGSVAEQTVSRPVTRSFPHIRDGRVMNRLSDAALRDLQELDRLERVGKAFRDADKKIKIAEKREDAAEKVAALLADLEKKVGWDSEQQDSLTPAVVAERAKSHCDVHKRLGVGAKVSIQAALPGTDMLVAGTRLMQTITLEDVASEAAGLFLHGFEDWAESGARIGGQSARGGGGELSGSYAVRMRCFDPARDKFGWAPVATIVFRPREPLTILNPDGTPAGEDNPIRILMRIWTERKGEFPFAFPDDLMSGGDEADQ